MPSNVFDLESWLRFKNRSDINTEQLSEMKKASSLVDAPNSDKKSDIKKLQKMFENKKELQKRNKTILKAYEKGYSQHMITKVLGVSQPAVSGTIKRSRK